MRGLALISTLALLATLAAPAGAEVVQRDGVRVAYDATLRPQRLPRAGTAPATIGFGARLTPPPGELPPRLREIRVALSRHAFLDREGLPVCPAQRIQPADTAQALRACRRSLIGEGRFAARVLIPGQAPFPSRGRVLAFYGTDRGRPAILAHIYGTDPIPTSYTVPFRLRRGAGAFGTVLTAALESSIGTTGYITLLRLQLGGRFGHLRARCPAAAGVGSALFPLAALSVGFPQSRLRTTLMRGCRVR